MNNFASAGRGNVVVTGTSSGIGRATALELDRMGFSVFATVRKQTDADSLAQAASPRLTTLLMDVTDEPAIAAAAERVAAIAAGAGLAGLVNNAGLGTFGPIEGLPIGDLRRQLETNVIGQVAVIQAFLPLVRKARGRIINIGSVGGRTTIPFGGALCASKHAIEAINDALHMELRPWGIEVCLVAPGSIHTPASDRMAADGEALIRAAAPQRIGPYLERFRKMLRAMTREESAGSPPEVVAKVIARALTDPRPRTRYPAGARSTLLALMPRVVPPRLLDAIKIRQMGLS